ncbi:Ig-like domain-containing protein [Hymenobacter jeollabukensis]|uniref:T9SS type A sorting domain-containing protein n=1 Tax=Hymenobacter jeollabukensis TaxID=2025313 RepID=A0A5R8WVI5_9BACT|nr:T9SS type A sorting domain-containing protein [Hymenobacter jeollabukensis]TLM95415.1 T9SS type A sorting domain-containing protein [Hymenobacter jeollabukensis]
MKHVFPRSARPPGAGRAALWRRGGLLTLLAALWAQLASAQTTLVTESFEGGSFGSFVAVNGGLTNRWVAGANAGNGPAAGGTGAAYISNNPATLPHAYSTGSAAVAHLYRDVAFPAGETAIRFSFDWRGLGEGIYDHLRVYLAPTSYVPAAGTLPAGTGVTLLLTNLHTQSAYTTADVNLSASLAGTSQRLIFTWTNDGSGGAQPPAAIDNVLLTSQVPTGLSGTYTIRPAEAASASNFRSLTAAINTLNANGVAGPVTVELAAGLTLSETLPALTASGTSTRRITFIRTGAGANPVLQTAAGTEAGFDLLGADYVTFDGIDVTGGASYGYRVRSASGTNGAVSNIIRNASITLSGASTTIGVVQVSNGQLGSASASAATGLNQGNRYLNLTITRAQSGIVALSMGATWPEYDLEIGGCTLGSADASGPIGNNATTAYGIRAFMVRRLSVHDNRVQNVIGAPAQGIYLEYCSGKGTNLTSTTDAGTGNDASNVYGNVVTGIRQFYNHSTPSFGLYVTTYDNNGQILNIYNNAVADVTAAPYLGPVTISRLITGFFLGTSGGYNNEANVWHNSVRIDGSASLNASNTCFELANSSVAKLNFRNNVLANHTGAGQGKHYCWLTPYSSVTTPFGGAGSVSDYNDLFVATAGNGFVGAAGNPQLNSGTVDKARIEDWRPAVNQDLHSLSVDPLFESATALRPSNTLLNNQATPLAAVTTDLTGAVRGSAPDAGAYEFSPAALDLAVDALLYPTATSCYSPTDEPVSVRLRNNGSAPITFSAAQPVTITVQVSGPVTQTLTYTFTSGTLAVGSPWQVGLPGPLPMAQPGVYTFNVSISTPGDAVAGNNTLTPAPTRTVLPTAALPQDVSFTGYTGGNLSAPFPNWYEATGAALPTPNDGNWGQSTTAFPGNTVARINLYTVNRQDWLVGPKVVATASTVLRFKAAIAEYNSPATTPDNTGGMANGTDDALQVLVSTDCGSSFVPVFTISAANNNVPTNGGGFVDFVVPLDAYAGQQIIVALKATDGPIDNTPDYDLLLDDLFIGTLTADVGVVALLNPLTTGCYSAAENVTVRVQNYGASPVSNVPVQVTVGGPVTTTLTATVPGPIPANGTADVVLGQVSLTAAGLYTFDASTQLTGDVTTGNDALAQQTRRQNGVAVLPQQLPFTGFADNLPTLYPGWFESVDGVTPASSAWTSNAPAQRVAFTETAKVNIFSSGRYAFLIGPRLLATATTRLSFRAGITDYNVLAADPTAMSGTDDVVRVGVSTNCGGSFSHVLTFDANNQPPNNGTLGLYDLDLSAYAGQEIIVAFFAYSGAVSNASDYDFHLDDVYLRNGASLDVRPVALAAPTVGGCFSAAEPVLLTVKNDGASLLDLSLNPITVTAVVTVPGGSTRTLTSTLNTGTLAAGATLDAAAGTLDMSATGTYSFALTATASGDANPANDPLGTAITRTVAGPTAGAISPSSTGVCENTSVQLTLAGSANGQVQWQQSTDNVTFTDISGANGLTYTSPALTANTWFRAQTRCLSRVATTSAVAVTVGTPRVISAASPVRRCGAGNVGLSASLSGGAAARWYDAPTGGTVVSNSSSFILSVSSSRSYYVAAVVTNGSGGECESARTAVQVLIDQPATADAGPATATVCGGGSYALSGSIGGGASGATWTATGSGTFTPNATALNATYQPSAADRTAGTVTLKLTTDAAGACGPAQDQLVLTLGGTLSTWTGAVSNDWFDAGNWTDCVPDANTDAYIAAVGGRPNPSIGGGTAAVRHLTVDGTGGLLMSGGLLRVWGSWQHSAGNTSALSGGTVQFDGDVNQPLTGEAHFTNLTINKTSGAALLHTGHIFVSGTLRFVSGRISAGTDPVTLEPGAQLVGESETAYVDGRIRTTLNLSAADVASTCAGLGLKLTPHGSTLPGLTTVLRSTGFYYSRSEGPMRLSIRRTFDIQPAVDQSLNVDMELRYLDAELNGLNKNNLTLFSSSNNATSWNQEYHQSHDTGTNTLVQRGLSHFSIWTLAEGAGPLPISLVSLTAQAQAAGTVLVRWETAQELDVLRYEVQVSTDGRTFRTIGTVLPATPTSTSRRQYSFVDRDAQQPGLRFYRLRQLDLDGTEALFGPRTVQIGRVQAVQFSAHPNPFGAEVRLRLSSPAAQPATTLHLLDARGRVVLTRTIEVPAGTSELTLGDLQPLPAGLYTLQLTLDGQPQRLKLVKQ